MKRALKLALIISVFSLLLIAGAGFLTQKTKSDKKAAETLVPDLVEYTNPSIVSDNYMIKRVKKSLNTKTVQPYSSKYQKAVDKILTNWENNGNYTYKEPLLIMNPYGTNRTGLYIYFRHDYKVTVKYNISLTPRDDIAVVSGASIDSLLPATEAAVDISPMTTKVRDFGGELYTNVTNMPLNVIEGQIVGLIPGRKNYVAIRLYDENGKQIAKAGFRITLPKSKTVNKRLLDSVYDRPVTQLSEGVFFVLGDNGKSNDILVYDNSGVIRADIPVLGKVSSQNVNVKTFDNKLFYAISDRYYVAVNNLGRVTDIYDMGKNLITSGDFDLKATSQAVVGIGSYNGGKTKNDLLVGVNIYNRETKLLCDMRDLLSDYYKEHGKKGTAKKPADWLGLNSVSFINDTDVLVSSSKTSSIIRINNVLKHPKIEYIIDPNESFMGTNEGDYALSDVNNNVTMSGQNNVCFNGFMEGSTTKYYITMFNNNYAKGGNENSYYSKIFVDEGVRTYAPAVSIPLTYSAVNGSAEENAEKGMVAASANELEFVEYNSQGNRLAKFRLPDASHNYRVVKRDMKGVWFARKQESE